MLQQAVKDTKTMASHVVVVCNKLRNYLPTKHYLHSYSSIGQNIIQLKYLGQREMNDEKILETILINCYNNNFKVLFKHIKIVRVGVKITPSSLYSLI